jgi:quercetin dioxygenase-like cupin family protein
MPDLENRTSELSTAARREPTRVAFFRSGRGFRSALKYSPVALLALLAGSLIDLPPVYGQAPPVALEVLAAGFSPERRIHVRTTGPSDVLQTRIVLQPAGDTGWHTHPGPVIVVVKSGTLTEYHDNGCVSVYQEGSVFFESAGEAHRVINEGSIASEAYATFLIPTGSQPLEPAADPGPRTCRPHHDHHDGGDDGE